ncbi:MAG: hypothetical protein ACYCZE_03095 [Thiobacillus sp.]
MLPARLASTDVLAQRFRQRQPTSAFTDTDSILDGLGYRLSAAQSKL